ncbi:MAG: alcohol dehydrogenase catalytic domain-containing protein [Clostridia bacterium]|nr:alcohol dehydrogenase catalytic domain-containing protein [Clostridia bacterium]
MTGIRDIEIPAINENEVLIRVKCAGVCGSDLHAYRGVHAFRKPPLILGHELTGIIVDKGRNVKQFSKGDRVAVMPQISCAQCKLCLSGYQNLCKEKKVPGMRQWVGAFAEYFNSPEDILAKLPENVDFEEGVLIEPLSVAIHVLKQISEEKREKLVILGSGTIGLLMILVAKKMGYKKILATDIFDYNLNFAKSLGAEKTVNVLKEDLRDAIKEVFGSDKADSAVITASAPDIIDMAIESVGPRGEIMLMAMITKPITFSSYPIVFNELVIKGSMNYTMEDFNNAIGIIQSKKEDLKNLITHRFRMDDVQKAMELADKKYEDSIKIIIDV